MAMPAVMIVEDEPIVAFHLHEQLRRLGYDVLSTSTSGIDALERHKETDPDIVLMDIRLEGEIDGIDTAVRMTRNKRTAVIYLTAHAEDETIARARETEPFGYLIKPFSERELHATIQIALQRRSSEQALRVSESRLRLALDAAEMGTWELDPSKGRLDWDRRAERIMGCDPDKVQRYWRSLARLHVHPEDRAAVEATLADIEEGEPLRQVDFRGTPDAGEVRWYRAQAKAFRGARDGARRIVGVVQDISARRDGETRLREAASVFEATREGILLLDEDLRVMAVNPGYRDMTGFAEEEVLGRRPPLLGPDEPSATAGRDAVEALHAAGYWHGELVGRRRDGAAQTFKVDLVAVRNEQDEFLHHVAVLSDITALRKAEKELRYLVHHDSLTGLANRVLAMARLHHGLERCRRHGGRIALLMVDIDRFKQINDTYGHSAGDELLKVVARRMEEGTRAEDTVARLGGDEFMIVCESVGHCADANSFTRKIVESVAEPVTVAGVRFDVSASIGVSIFPDDADNSEDLVRTADTALYVTKERGRNGFTFHSPDMRDRIGHQLSLEQDLRCGMANRELQLFFQPQIDLASGKLVGAEALLRRLTEDGTLLGPETIVPVAERGDLIVEIGDWVIHEVCRHVLAWQSMGVKPVRISVNVSALQFRQDCLLRTFCKLAEMPHVHRDLIELEITESTLQTEPRSLQAMRELADMGASFAIDDFGTGYSNLSSLKHLPLSRLKIDKSLVRDVPDDSNDAAIIEAIIAMGHRLNLKLVAEGVERRDQHDFLLGKGCEEAQGYYYARPMPSEAFLAMLLREEGSFAIAADLPAATE